MISHLPTMFPTAHSGRLAPASALRRHSGGLTSQQGRTGHNSEL